MDLMYVGNRQNYQKHQLVLQSPSWCFFSFLFLGLLRLHRTFVRFELVHPYTFGIWIWCMWEITKLSKAQASASKHQLVLLKLFVIWGRLRLHWTTVRFELGTSLDFWHMDLMYVGNDKVIKSISLCTAARAGAPGHELVLFVILANIWLHQIFVPEVQGCTSNNQWSI